MSAQCLPDGVWLRNGEGVFTVLASGIHILVQWEGGETAKEHDVRKRPMSRVCEEHGGRRSVRGQGTRQSRYKHGLTLNLGYTADYSTGNICAGCWVLGRQLSG